MHPTFFENVKNVLRCLLPLKAFFFVQKLLQSASSLFSLFGAQCFTVFSLFSCDRLASVKVKVLVFIVAVVGSLSTAYVIRICAGCA